MPRTRDVDRDSQSDFLSLVTLIVPTVSRPSAVRRHFEYWAGSGVKVLILDGAKQPISLSEHELATRNVTYIHSGTRFNERLASAGQLVTTPYAALLCDDEFFLKDGLRESVSFLEDNPSVIGCTGKVLGFFVDQNRFLTFPMYEDWKSFPPGIDDARNRLDFALPPNKAHKVQYSLFRSEIWADSFTKVTRTFTPPGTFTRGSSTSIRRYLVERNFSSAWFGCAVWRILLSRLRTCQG